VAGAFPAVRRLELERGSGVAARTRDGRIVDGGGAGPELGIVLYLEDGLDAAGVNSLTVALNEAWSRNELFAERVDSVEVRLKRAAG
jgi:hypothetical protein